MNEGGPNKHNNVVSLGAWKKEKLDQELQITNPPSAAHEEAHQFTEGHNSLGRLEFRIDDAVVRIIQRFHADLGSAPEGWLKAHEDLVNMKIDPALILADTPESAWKDDPSYYYALAELYLEKSVDAVAKQIADKDIQVRLQNGLPMSAAISDSYANASTSDLIRNLRHFDPEASGSEDGLLGSALEYLKRRRDPKRMGIGLESAAAG